MEQQEEKKFGPVWFIPGLNRGKYPYCHSVYVEGAGVLIDPACNRERLKELRAGPGVKEVWLSHWHEDHIMYLDLFDDLPLKVMKLDAPPLADADVFMDWYGMHDPKEREAWRAALKTQFNFKPRVPAETFKGSMSLELDGVTVDVIHSPGHTPGHLAFFFREPAVLFMGDYDLGKFGPWYGDVGSSIDDTIASVEALRALPARVWITGHEYGLFESDPADHFDRYLAIIDERESKLIDYLCEPRTIEDIIGQWIIYRKPREPKQFFEFGERALMSKHVKRLVGKGEVERRGDRYVKV